MNIEFSCPRREFAEPETYSDFTISVTQTEPQSPKEGI